MNSRVLILDADFRRPAIASALNLSNETGLSDVLATNLFQPTQEASELVQKCIRQFEALNNLWVLPAGPLPPNPSELLASPNMKQLVRRLRHDFDHVLIDSPPVLLISDAIILSNKADGVLMVVENERTQRGALRRACRVLTNSGARILGAVLNKVDTRRDGYSGHYSSISYGDTYQAYTEANGVQNS
jgi:capsular exopolysaccharide synthesis family protein